jgi:NAD(P)-dependent dehydrogenase (short-subunit alcohol dehydrogenase family)/SAM-dependent methyltransferase
MLGNLGLLYSHGCTINWRDLWGKVIPQLISLPTYPWQRQRYWLEEQQGNDISPVNQRPSTSPQTDHSPVDYSQVGYPQAGYPQVGYPQVGHPLLGRRLDLPAAQEIRFESTITGQSPAYLGDHRIDDRIVFLGAAYLEMALAAGAAFFQSTGLSLKDVAFTRVLFLSETESTTLHLVLKPDTGTMATWQVFSQAQSPHTNPESVNSQGTRWTLHAEGKVCCQVSSSTTSSSTEPSPPDLGHGLGQSLAECKKQCGEARDLAFYDQVLNLAYGPLLRNTERMWLGEQAVLVKVRLQDSLLPDMVRHSPASEPIAPDSQSYLLHPALLDGCLQGLFPLFEGMMEDDGTYLPVGCERLHLYRLPGPNLWSHGRLYFTQVQGQQVPRADVQLFSPEGDLIATLKGLRGQRISSPGLFGQSANLQTTNLQTTNLQTNPGQPQWHQWLYEIEWQRQCCFSSHLQPDYFPPLTEITTQLEQYLGEAIVTLDLTAYQAVFQHLEALSVAYGVAALIELGCPLQPGQILSGATLRKQLGIISQHHRLLWRLLQLLTAANILEPNIPEQTGITGLTGADWRVKEVPAFQDLSVKLEGLLAQYPIATPELTLLGRCGPHLATVLRGDRDPLSLLFPEGDLGVVTQLYGQSPGSRVMNGLVQQAISTALAQLPRSQGVKILEIGAGTGGTTAEILPCLSPAQTEYVSTDIGPLFMAKAKTRFRDYPFVRYQPLDISQPPSHQGFEPQEYEVVVAANVLHATPDLRQTLHHVQQLLKPGGLLILLEGTIPQGWVDLSFGLLEGWWQFTDTDLRPDYPLLNAIQWQRLLLETGFQATVTVPAVEKLSALDLDQQSAAVLAQQVVIVAQTQFIQTQSDPMVSAVTQATPSQVTPPQVMTATPESTFSQIGHGQWDSSELDVGQLDSSGLDAGELDPNAPGHWLIFADHEGLGRALSTKFQAVGETCTLAIPHLQNDPDSQPLLNRITDNGTDGNRIAEPGTGNLGTGNSGTGNLGTSTWTVNPHSLQTFEQLLAISMAQSAPLKGIIHLWSLDSPEPEQLDAESLQQAAKLGCGSVLHLVQALVHLPWAKTSVAVPRLWLVTRNAQVVPQAPRQNLSQGLTGLAQVPLWSLGHTIALEYPKFRCVRLDLGQNLEKNQTIKSSTNQVQAEQVQALWQTIWSDNPEDRIVFRSGDRYIARFIPTQFVSPQTVPAPNPSDSSKIPLKENKTYLITGGLGDLGLFVARWLVLQGAKWLVLVSRHSPQEPRLSKIEGLQQLGAEMGAEIRIAQADVAIAEEIGTVLEQIRSSGYPLGGVIHGAGVLDNDLLQQLDWERFAKVLAPKVQGGWHLHHLTQSESLDFFIGFSSVAAPLGALGQANHAAANGFLDALMWHRRALGLPGLSINWGAVGEIGSAARQQLDTRMEQQGLGRITPDQVLQLLAYLGAGLIPRFQRFPSIGICCANPLGAVTYHPYFGN